MVLKSGTLVSSQHLAFLLVYLKKAAEDVVQSSLAFGYLIHGGGMLFVEVWMVLRPSWRKYIMEA